MPDPDAAADLASWAVDLEIADVPARVRRSAGILRASTVGATAWTLTHPVAEAVLGAARRRGTGGKDRVPLPGSGSPTSPREAAAAGAALSVAQDFDDTLLGGHVSHSAVWVPLALGAARGHDGDEVVAAQIAASEVAARLGAAGAVGDLRGQMTTYVHAAAAAVARARLEGASADEAAAALRAALEAPQVPTRAGFLGGSGKVRAIRDPVRTGWDALDDARDGLPGRHGVIEAEDGFLEVVSDHPLPAFLGGLGTRWHLSAPTVKANPACYYALAPVEAALDLADAVDPGDAAGIEVEASLFTVEMDEASAPYVTGPGTGLSALTFTVGWNVAAALADGEHTPRQLHPDRVDDPATWELAEAVTVTHDPNRTAQALEAEIPVGLPLRRVGPKVVPYAAGVLGAATTARNLRLLAPFLRRSPLPDDLSEAEKAIGATVRVEEDTGATLEASVDRPRGSAGRGLDEAEDVARTKARRGLQAGADASPEGASDLADTLLELGSRDHEAAARVIGALAGEG